MRVESIEFKEFDSEAGGIHTSTSTVAVLREAKDVEISIDPNDLEINVCRASGPGERGC